MAYPVAATKAFTNVAASPAYSGTFIPEIWSGKIIEKFYASSVLSAISNTDYEGELKNQGDKVTIRTKPTLTINNYQADQAIAVERPSSNVVTLLIDKGKYFAAILDDVYDIQSDINMMSLWADDAAQQMKITIDTDVLLGMKDGATAVTNRGLTAGAQSASLNLGVTGTPVAVVNRNPAAGKVEVIDLLVRLGQALDEQNIPEQGRWVVMPTWVASLIKTSELRDAALSGDGQSMLRNGRLGMVDRFTIYTSNLMPSGVAAGLAAGEWLVYAGHSHALTFASQLTKVETIRSETTFGNILRGLQIYGYKVLDGKALAQAVVSVG
jgi:hypothetical protein